MKMHVLLAAPLLLLAACSPPSSTNDAAAPPTVQMSADTRARMSAVNQARLTTPMAATMPERVAPLSVDPAMPEMAVAATPAAPAPAGAIPAAATPADTIQYDAGLVRIQVLLDRAHFSPGVIDGYDGANVRKAVSAYQDAHALTVTGLADDTLLTQIEMADNSPALVAYVISADDVRGPFAPAPQGLEAMSHLDRVGYANAAEALAEKFHMDEDLLRTLNPGVDFAAVGSEIVVANAGGDLAGPVASIEVDKGIGAVRAFDASNQLLAFYPASIGSADAPAPTGDYTVRAVAFDPTYHYDPSRLPTFGQTGHGALTIPAGPNNPVGAVWIALSLDTYGIHGAANPSQISKTQSHGCVRLTNWDATELGHAVRAGVPVRFREGSNQAQRTARRG